MPCLKIPVLKNWKLIVSVTLPIISLPILFVGETDEAQKRSQCGYTIIVMGILWMFEVLPLSVTALIPIVLFPFFGIQSTSQVVSNYMKDTQMMFVAGISIALSLQYSNLHKRIALRILILIGSTPWRLLIGILLATFLLSCVIIVNTAVAAMMIPIVAGIVDNIELDEDPLDEGRGRTRRETYKVLYMLAVGYGANIGGTATLIGSQPNLIYREIIEKENISQNGKYTDLNFFTFLSYSGPIALINLISTWIILGWIHLGFRQPSNQRRTSTFRTDSSIDYNGPSTSSSARLNPSLPRTVMISMKTFMSSKDHAKNQSISNLSLTDEAKILQVIRTRYSELGPMSFHECVVLASLLLAVTLWLTKEPQVFPGWLQLFSPHHPKISDSSVGIAIVLLMCIIPQKLQYFNRDFNGESKTVLTWDYIQKNFPWNVLFIVGGGLAISDGANASGLSSWIGEQLLALQNLDRSLMLFLFLVIISLFTEVMSNAATVSILTPILLDMSKRLDIHPLYIGLPGAIACQYAFMLPTSNPPNAIVYSAGNMEIKDMIKSGIPLNFICLALLYLMNLTWGEYVIFHFKNYQYSSNSWNSSVNL